MAVLGGVIARGEPHWRVFDLLAVQPPQRPRPFTRDDLYPDALACLARVSPVGVVGAGGRDFRVEPSLSGAQILQWLDRHLVQAPTSARDSTQGKTLS